MKNSMKKSLSVAMGATFAAAMATSPVASADANPFGMQNLESGYMHVAEAKCGGEKSKEAKCGGKKAKEMKCGEGKCGEKKAANEGKCGDKMKEKKCGGEKTRETGEDEKE